MPTNKPEYINDYMRKYAKENIKQINVPFNTKNEEDRKILEWLESRESKVRYIKGLILRDMTTV